MRKYLRLTAIILVFASLLFIRPMQAMALDPGDYEVTYGTACNTLATNPVFTGLSFFYGYRVDGTTSGTYPFDETLGGAKTGPGQLDDPTNSVTLTIDATTFSWGATTGIDAVIVHGSSTAYAYYYSPESGGAGGLQVGNTGETISSIEVCFDYELSASTTQLDPIWYKFIDWSIVKTANATSAAAFAGASPNLTYTVDLTKFEDPGPYELSGEITLTNPSPYNVPFTVVDSAGGTNFTVTCRSSTGAVRISLLEFETLTCTFSGALSSNASGTNTATFNTTSRVGGVTTSRGYSFGSAILTQGSDPETVTVTDSLKGSLGSFSATGSTSYAATTVCPVDSASYTSGLHSEVMNNTATIQKTQPESSSLSIPLNCYAPRVSKTAIATAYKTVDWTIGKSVAQTSQNQLAGDSATFNYTVSLDKQVTDGPFVVEGTITVANPVGAPGNMPVSVSDALGGVTAAVDCDPNTGGNQSNLSVPPGQSRDCAYTANLASAANGTNTAMVSLNGAAFPATAGYTFGAPVLNPESEPDFAIVSDSFQGGLGTYFDDATIPYNRLVGCPGSQSAYTNGLNVVNLNNTATITNIPGHTASAPAALNCFAPVVSKSATASFTELHRWSLNKMVDPALQNALAGQTAHYTWQIQVNETVTEQDYAVGGTIQVTNPAPLPMSVGLSDALDDNTPGVIGTCTNGTFAGGMLNIAANTTASCTYSAAPTSRNAASNTATATLNGNAFTASTGFTWTANAFNTSVTIDDDHNPNFPITISEGGSYSYAGSHPCSIAPTSYTGGKYTFNESNTVTLKAGQTTLASSTADAAVDCYAPLLSKTASASYTEQHDWTLSKTVAPAAQSVFAGQSASYTWAIDVTELVTEKDFAVDGQISVVNPAPLSMTVSLSDTLSDATPAQIGPCTGGTFASGSLTIPASTTAVCDYTAAPAGRTAIANTASLNLNGYILSNSVSFTWNATLVNPSVTLNDDQNPDLPQTLTGTTAISYKETYACPTDQAGYTAGLAPFSESNTATLMSGQELVATQTASVSVDCFGPMVSKTANAAYTAEHTWTLEKTVSQANQKAFAGASVPFTWTLNVGHQVTETGFAVTGQIIVVNPAGQAMQVDLTDALGDGTQATIIQSPGCSYTAGKLNIPANGTAVCSYTAAPLDRTATTNTAVAILNGVEFTGGHALDWAASATNPTVILDDDRNPAFPVELTDGGVFTYDETPACPADQAAYLDGFMNFVALNTATLSAGTTVLAQDSATFSVDCYAPMVSKTAAGTTYRGINWFITKTADQPNAASLAGGSATLGYTLTLEKQLESELHLVEGEITITSPAGAPAPMNLSVTDLVVPTGLNTVPAAVDCDPALEGNQAALSLDPGAVHVCTYTAGLDSPTGGTNTAFVNLNEVYFSALVDYVFGTTDLSKSEPEAITVTDSLAGVLGPFSESATVPYTAEAACPTDPAAYVDGVASVTVGNTATINETFNDQSSASVQLDCYAPTVSKTASATAYKSINWSIAKSAQQAEQAAFAGQSATFDYTVTLTKDETSGLNVVEGVITVSSPASAPAEMALTVADLVQPTGLAPVAAVVDCDPNTMGNQPTVTLAAGASAACTYYAELLSAANGLNTASATLGGVVFTGSMPFTFGEQVEGITEPATVTVTDDLAGQTWTFDQSGSQNYSYTAACPADQASYTDGLFVLPIGNTAAINETQNDSASANVTLNCFAPLVSKTASAVAYESIDWTLDKVGIQPPHAGIPGGVVAFDYQITATRQVTPGPFLVSGEISLANPAGAPGALALSVADMLVPDGQAAIPVTADCDPQTGGNQVDVTLGPGESVSCGYTAELAEPLDGTNTATVLANGVSFTASADYIFGAPVLAEGSEPGTITVMDEVDAWTTSQTQTFNLTRPQACPSDPAAYTAGYFTTPVNNTATIFETGDTDSATLDLECFAPLVSKTASATAYTSLDWTLTKTASPASASLFAGQGMDVEYTLDLALSEVAGPNLVQGEISVTNPNPATGIVVSVADMTGGIPASVDCDPLMEGDQATLGVPAGGTGVCTYLAHLPEAVDGTNTATVTFGNVAFTATAPYTFGPPQPSPISEPGEVKITDSLGGTFGPFTAEATIKYTSPAACPVEAGAYQDGIYGFVVTNTASLTTPDGTPLPGIMHQAEADVSLECFAPLVSKTAAASWTKTIDWTLAKTVGPLSADLLAGESADFAYTLTLAKNETPGAYLVAGAVTLANPAGAPGALRLSVSDVLQPDGQPDLPVTLDCGPTQPDPADLVLQPGESVECAYSVFLDGPFDGLNSATVIFAPPQLLGEVGEAGGTFVVTAPYAFGAAELLPGSEPETVALTDTFDGQPEDLGSFDLGQDVSYTRTLACPADAGMYVDGVYSFSMGNFATLSTGDQAEQTVTVNCTLPGSPAQVVKVIEQGSQAIGQFPVQFALYAPGAAVPVETTSLTEAEVTGDGEYTLPFQTLVTAGTWTVKELLPDGWLSTETTCTLVVPEVVTTGQVLTCTFANTELSRLRLLKTTNGQVDPSRDWRFVLAGSASRSTLGDVDGWLEFGLLDPDQAYTVCELTNEKKWASVWSSGGVILPGYYLNGYHCVDTGAGTALPLQPGETLALRVDNVSTLGAPGSSGYWKNSNELAELLSRYTFTIGTLQLGTSSSTAAALRLTSQDDWLNSQVAMAVLLLDQRDLGTGKKMSSDALYQLAAELLVYRLNQANGACVRPEAEAVANSAQALLLSLNFNGHGAYVRHPDATMKAAALAKYNNGSCGK